ncbi:alpha-N-acetylneuraminate alpha-2,8-sialyltransferase ST8SIA3-like [Apostichopus japonicus]|uniref:alpha-N-acetylneuraminate alpha-2,8-sialyltransferase ST8SIA3-like n=1 Tax=Stichopus japonicus TaxID=307972 RepID=UPI003AB71065
MSKFVRVFITLCFISLVFISLAYLETRSSGKYIKDVQISVAYDVEKLCEKICDRNQESCFEPNSVILVYQNVSPDLMKFRQQFSPMIRQMNLSSLVSDATNGKFQRRPFCSLDEIDPVYRTLRKVRKCAIIGNGGIILQSRCGQEIDANDLVIRANFAGLESYEQDVGNKTSVMMINDETLTNMYNTLVDKKSGVDGLNAMMKYITRHLNDSTIWFAKSTEAHNSATRLQKIATFFAENELRPKLAYSMMHVTEAVKSKEWKFRGYPSSGIDILAVAESLCVNITLYGFYPYEKDPHGRPVLHHYYQPNLTNFHTRAHNFDREHKMLKDMHKRGLLRLVYDPCVTAAANVTG